MCGDLHPLPHTPSWHDAQLSIGCVLFTHNYFYVLVGETVIRDLFPLYTLK